METEQKNNPQETAQPAAQAEPGNTQADAAHKEEEQKDLIFASLAYLGPCVIISYILGKDRPFVKFHIKQGLVVLSMFIILWVINLMIPFSMIMVISKLMSIAYLIVMVFVVIGIINVVQKKEKELPFVGSFAKHFKI